MSFDPNIQEESEQWRNHGRARAASIADTEVRVLLTSLNSMSANTSVSAQSSDSEHSDLEFEIENLLKGRNRTSSTHAASNTKRIKRRSQMTGQSSKDQHTSTDELPTDQNQNNKEFWDQIQKTLQKEAETKLLEEPSNTPKQRKRTKSWLEAKDKIAKNLEAQSAPESTATSTSSSFSQYATDSANNTEPAPSIQDSSSWWSDLKLGLDKETGAPPEAPKPEDDLSEFADESTLNEPTDNSWWSDLKSTLEQESPATTNDAKTPSENNTPSANQTRPKKDRQSQSDSGYDSGSSAPPTPSTTSIPATPVFPNSNRIDFQDAQRTYGKPHRDSSTYGSLRFNGVPEAMEAKKGILRFDNGVYRGDIIVTADNYSLAHGYGSFTTSTEGEMYIGQWRMGKRDGKGIKVWADGREYVGQWSNNRRSGHGIITWPNGDTYIGEIQFGFQQGHGVMKSNGEKYVGEWNVNERHGFGVMHFKNGDTYSGEWAHNKKHGHGTYKFFDGQVVEGEWENNKFTGAKKQAPIPDTEIAVTTPDRKPSTADTEVVSLQNSETTTASETKTLDSSSDTAQVESSHENNTTTAPVAAVQPTIEASTSTSVAPVATTSTQTITKDKTGSKKHKKPAKNRTVKEKVSKDKEHIDNKNIGRSQSLTGINQKSSRRKGSDVEPAQAPTVGKKLGKTPSTKSIGSVKSDIKDVPTKDSRDTPSNDNAVSGSDKDAPSKPKKEEKKRKLFSFSLHK